MPKLSVQSRTRSYSAHEPFGVAGVEAHGVRVDDDFGIQRAHARRRERGFVAGRSRPARTGLAMQVGGFEPVAVDDADAADAGAGEILQHRNAEAARADHEHRGGAQSRLALRRRLRSARSGASSRVRRVRRAVGMRWRASMLRVRACSCAGVRALVRMAHTLAVDPARIAIDVVLLLPDGHAVFDFIDDVAAGAKRLVAMRGAHADPHGDVADAEVADAMHARRALHAKALDRFLDDALAFLLREPANASYSRRVTRVAFVVIAHPAFERRVAAAALVASSRVQRRGVERRVR